MCRFANERCFFRRVHIASVSRTFATSDLTFIHNMRFFEFSEPNFARKLLEKHNSTEKWVRVDVFLCGFPFTLSFPIRVEKHNSTEKWVRVDVFLMRISFLCFPFLSAQKNTTRLNNWSSCCIFYVDNPKSYFSINKKRPIISRDVE